MGRDGPDPVARIAAIRGRVDAAIGDGNLPAGSVHLETTATGVEVWMGSRFLWVVLPGDFEVDNVRQLAPHVAGLKDSVEAAIREGRAKRKPLRLLISAGIAVVLTVLAWAVFRLLLAAGLRFRTLLARKLEGRLPSLRIGNFEIVSQAQLGGTVVAVLGHAHLVVAAFLFYAYLTTVTSLFPWTQGWSWLLVHFAIRQMTAVILAIAGGIPGLVAIVIIFIVFRRLAGLSDRFFRAIEDGSVVLGGFHRELALPTKRLVRFLLWIVAINVAYPDIPGAQSKAVQGLSLLFGVMLSLGSTGFVGNVISGLVITYSRSFHVGDRVRVGDHVGDIVHLGVLATKIRSIRNEEITVPNGQVTASAVINYTRLAADPGLVLHTEVTIGYDVEWRKVHELLIAAAGLVDGVDKEPPPRVFQRSLNDAHVSYELTCVTGDSHAQMRLYSDLHARIQDAFAAAGVEILSPAYHAVRDANAPVLLATPHGPRGPAGGFRMRPGE